VIDKDSNRKEKMDDSLELPPMVIWLPMAIVTLLFVAWCSALGRVAWVVATRS
jgi:hypothetical protein